MVSPIAPAARSTLPAVVVLHNLDPLWAPSDTAIAMDSVNELVNALVAEGHRVHEVPVTDTDIATVLEPYKPAKHIVFNWCEELPGIPHSDAQVAACLEQLGYTYTGSPPEVLSLSWDKAAVKAALVDSGSPTPYGRVVDTDFVEDWNRFPAIVKPAFEHCSLGIDTNAVVLDAKELSDRVVHIRKTFAQPALVEEFIDGREFHVTLWGNGRIHMLPPVEMDFSAFTDVRERLCTFDSKFTPGSRHYEGIESHIPALDTGEHSALQRTSEAAYRQLGCRDFARLDLRLRDDKFYVLDVNPNADISSDTSLAYAAEAAGMAYGGFLSRLVNLAAERRPTASSTGALSC